MLYERKNINGLHHLIQSLSDKQCSIYTQYKLLKILECTENENNIYEKQILQLMNYLERDENNQLIQNDKKGYLIKPEYFDKCNQILQDINNVQIQVPDIYFSLEELEELKLTLSELKFLMPFVKN